MIVLKRFQIKSHLNKKVLKASLGTDSKHPSNVQVWDPLSIDDHQQMWYLGENQTIQCVSNDFCLTSNGIQYLFIWRKWGVYKCNHLGEYPASVTVEPCSNTEGQKWTVKDNTVVNLQNPDGCLNIPNDDQENGAQVTLFDECSSESDLHLFDAVSLDSMMILDDNEPMEYFDSYRP